MPVRPAVPGLIKHQLMFTAGPYIDSIVVTIWTYKNAFPVAQARVDYERAQLSDWLTNQWASRSTSYVSASRIKTWNMGSTFPAKYDNLSFFPPIAGTISGFRKVPMGTSGVISLRTQPIGSSIRNRLNGRIFHPGVFSCDQDSLLDPSASSLDACYENLLTRLKTTTNPDSGTWSVVSYRAGHAYRATPLVLPVNHILVRGQVGFRRTRMPHPGAYAVGA